jgi:hypothetical protein
MYNVIYLQINNCYGKYIQPKKLNMYEKGHKKNLSLCLCLHSYSLILLCFKPKINKLTLKIEGGMLYAE